MARKASRTSFGSRGFTIVELLIVIVVIAILAAITIVSFNGIQNQAHDSSVQNDLRNIGQKIEAYKAQYGTLPSATAGGLSPLGLKIATGSYSDGVISSGNYFNLVYCRGLDNAKFALVGWSKSGSGFAFIDGRASAFNHAPAASAVTCPDAGLATGTYSYFWFKSSNVWASWL